MGKIEFSEPESGETPEWRGEGVRKTGLLANWRILAVTMYIGMSLFEYGYDKGTIAGFQAMPGFLKVFGYQTPDGKWAIEAGPQQIIASFMTLGALIGALSIGHLGAYLCRRHCLMIASVLLIASVAIMVETTSFGALYFARLLCGLANGILLNFSFVFLQESAPPHLRGLCFGMATFWLTFGTTLGMVVNKEMATVVTRQAYQIPLYVCFPIPALLILTLPFLPESPRWLLHHHCPEEALKSLHFFRKGAYDEVAVLQEFEEMKAVAEREAETSTDWRLMFEMFRGNNLRRTIICVGFFTIAQVGDPFMWTIVTNCVGLAGLIFSWFVVQRVGHRRLILSGTALCTISMLIIAILYTVPGISVKGAGTGLVVACSLYLFGFNLGLESYSFLTAGELPAQNLRAYTMGLSVGTSFIFAWLCAFTAPYFINPAKLNWGPKYAWIWFVSGLISTAFLYFMLPDVKGRSLEEIDEMFRNKVPIRGFKTYICREIEEARSRGLVQAVAQDKKELAQDNEPVEKHVENA